MNKTAPRDPAGSDGRLVLERDKKNDRLLADRWLPQAAEGLPEVASSKLSVLRNLGRRAGRLLAVNIAGAGLAFLAHILFGLLLRFLDGWLDPSGGWLIAMFRAAWLTYLPVRIMSADPYASLKSGFQLIVGTMVLLALLHLAVRRSNAGSGA